MGVVETSNTLTIKATAAKSETKLAIFGGSSASNYWIIGQNSFGVCADNLVFGNSASGPVLQLNQDRDISIPKQLTVAQNAEMTTLQVNQNTYLNGSVLVISVDINTLYQTRAWVSLKVSYNASNQTPVTVYQYGRATATVSRNLVYNIPCSPRW